MDKSALLQSIRSRTGRSGVLTADRYFKSIQACFDGGFCPTKLFKGASPEQWEKALKDAESILTYSVGKVDKRSFKSVTNADPKGIGTFEAIITTTKQDRDGDRLETKGAIPDPKMPLLFNHVSMMPVGSMLRVTKHTDSILKARFIIADTDLGHDVMKLIEAGALRISHGFEPRDYEPLEGKNEGWHFLSFDIFETSVVAVPSNTDAEITAYSRNDLKDEGVRAWAKKAFEARPLIVAGADLPAKAPVCTCGAKSHQAKEAYGDVTGSYEELRGKLQHDIARYFAATGHALDRDEWAYIHSTFPNYVIVCICEDYCHEEHYRISWKLESGVPTLFGEAVEVELRLTAEEKSRQAMFHRGTDGLPFGELRKDVVQRAFAESPETINELVLSLQGVTDQAIAHREDVAWQETFESLGID